jgi:hypothetical protein
MRKLTTIAITFGFAATAAACITDEEDLETSVEAAETVCREVQHFTYAYGGSQYRWDVTTEFTGTGRQFVDEWRQGNYGGTHVQYRVSPSWSRCSRPGQEYVQLTGAVTLTGAHNCLADGRQEFHGSDYQRLLQRASPAYSFNCQP